MRSERDDLSAKAAEVRIVDDEQRIGAAVNQDREGRVKVVFGPGACDGVPRRGEASAVRRLGLSAAAVDGEFDACDEGGVVGVKVCHVSSPGRVWHRPRVFGGRKLSDSICVAVLMVRNTPDGLLGGSGSKRAPTRSLGRE